MENTNIAEAPDYSIDKNLDVRLMSRIDREMHQKGARLNKKQEIALREIIVCIAEDLNKFPPQP